MWLPSGVVLVSCKLGEEVHDLLKVIATVEPVNTAAKVKVSFNQVVVFEEHLGDSVLTQIPLLQEFFAEAASKVYFLLRLVGSQQRWEKC